MAQLCIEDDKRAGTLVTIRSKYYAMQALAAALKWIELVHNTIFPPRTLNIVYRTIEGKILVPRPLYKLIGALQVR